MTLCKNWYFNLFCRGHLVCAVCLSFYGPGYFFFSFLGISRSDYILVFFFFSFGRSLKVTFS